MRLKMKKIIFSILLIIFLCINNFAAIVSDNDGSAFVTKAEFDALKTSFNTQITNYNESIDSKIDGAIASYISGLKISEVSELQLTYDNSWYWNSNTSKSFDNVSQKKFYHNALFYTRTNHGSNGYTAVWSFEPFDKSTRYYNTYEAKVNDKGLSIFEPKKICFRNEALLYFARGGPETGGGNSCGGIQWYNFWPAEMNSNEIIYSNKVFGNVYWYDGWSILYVDYDETYTTDTIICPYSESLTYYFEDYNKLWDSDDKGTQVTYVKDNVRLKRISTFWSAADVANIGYYPDQLVSSDSNKNIKTNEMCLKALYEVNANNNKMKYGVQISNTVQKGEGTINISLIPKAEGTLYFALGNDITTVWDSTNIAYQWEHEIITSELNNEVKIKSPNLSMDKNQIIAMISTDTTSSYKLDILSITSISQ